MTTTGRNSPKDNKFPISHFGHLSPFLRAQGFAGLSATRPNQAELALLVAESEQAGLSLVRKLVDEWRDGSNAFHRPGEAVFGARVDGRLVGVCGLNVDPYAGDDRIGRVRHRLGTVFPDFPLRWTGRYFTPSRSKRNISTSAICWSRSESAVPIPCPES